jgi:predicted MFS family arabinose efflux permease
MRSPPSPSGVTSRQVFLFAFAAAIMVANLYGSQPLLADIGASFGLRGAQAGYLVTMTQLGYGLGVLLIVPLGDVMDRRRLASRMLAGCLISLLMVVISPTFLVLTIASLAVGMTSSATMVVIPYVASRSSEAERGRRIGQVVGGLLLGILLARTVSGFVGDHLGWRAMYVIAALAVLMIGFALRRVMVPDPDPGTFSYVGVLRSLLTLWRAQPELRVRSLYAMSGLSGFSALWTGLTFLLTAPPYNYSPSTVGLFGLIGAAGALSASFAGRLGDRGHATAVSGVLAAILVLSWALLEAGRTSMMALIAGIFLLDVAVQGLQVTHQAVIYRLDPARPAPASRRYSSRLGSSAWHWDRLSGVRATPSPAGLACAWQELRCLP